MRAQSEDSDWVRVLVLRAGWSWPRRAQKWKTLIYVHVWRFSPGNYDRIFSHFTDRILRLANNQIKLQIYSLTLTGRRLLATT